MRLLGMSLLSAALLSFGGCGGGGSGDTGNLRATCAGRGNLCIASCNLGCSISGGCSISDIAVNQPLVFVFNQPIDKDSVNSTSFNLRGSLGGVPLGDYVVQGNKVLFVPNQRTVGGQPVFGFRKGETYSIHFESGPTGIRSVGGATLSKAFDCSVRASLGVIDLDGKPPEAKLLIPTQLTNVPVDTLVVLEFSEVINTSTFQNGGAGNALFFKIRLPDSNGKCTARELPLPGTVSVSIDPINNRSRVVFRPTFLLPGNSCIRVQVTNQILDLAGNGSKEADFEFRTEPRAAADQFIDENFASKGRLDPIASGAIWKGDGKLLAGKLGGSGILGDFDVRFGTDKGKDKNGRHIYEWDTTRIFIPARATLDGKDHTITNGVFEFTSFVLKGDQVMRIVGPNIPRFFVSGRVQIDGEIELVVPPFKKPSAWATKGAPGGKGAVGGATGGQGADRGDLKGGDFNGRPGGVVQLPPGHPRAAQAVGTGGQGSKGNPQDKKTIFEALTYFNGSKNSAAFSRQGSAGGGGGSLWSPDGKSYLGQPGKMVKTNTKPKEQDMYDPKEFGPDAPGGKPFPVLPVVLSKKSSDLFLIGGSGGGGGGSHILFSPATKSTGTIKWSPGAGGAGGGGVIHFQVGNDFILGGKGSILAEGGFGYSVLSTFTGGESPAAGGGGSGGSVLIQTGGIPTISGIISVLGGKGGVFTEGTVGYLWIKIVGGQGGAGYIRVEADPAPNHISFGSSFKPAPTPQNVGLLRPIDYSTETLARSKWYAAQTLFPPTWLSYVIKAKVDGVPVTYSDDIKKFPGSKPAKTGEAVVFLIQSTDVDVKSGIPIGKLTPWVEGTVKPLNSFQGKVGNGFRFMIRFDRSKTASGKGSIEVDSLRVFYRG